MSSTQSSSTLAGDRSISGRAETARDRSRRRAMRVTAVIAVASFALLVDLLLVRHTVGEEIWGPITAAMAALVAGLSLAFLATRGRNRAARIVLIALWLTVAFFGFGGYNSHRLALPEGTVDSRTRPPLAPLIFTGLGIAGALSLRSGTKGN
jgi:hypothetical protein